MPSFQQFESLCTAVYFSIVTIATVGYGDIQPASVWARLRASAEILIGVAYTVFFFSVIAGFLRGRAISNADHAQTRLAMQTVHKQ
jgi:voltage-gated potassium channel